MDFTVNSIWPRKWTWKCKGSNSCYTKHCPQYAEIGYILSFYVDFLQSNKWLRRGNTDVKRVTHIHPHIHWHRKHSINASPLPQEVGREISTDQGAELLLVRQEIVPTSAGILKRFGLRLTFRIFRSWRLPISGGTDTNPW